jgi:hypothetical protein
MARASAVLAVIVALVAGLLLVSGGSDADPRTPAGLPGLPAPFLGTAVVGAGGPTAAIDAYGDVVDLRRSPAGPALLAVPAARQAAGTVAPAMALVPRLRLADGRSLPFWRADAVTQRYLPGTNVLVTTARFGSLLASVTYTAGGEGLACVTRVRSGVAASTQRHRSAPSRAQVLVSAGAAAKAAAQLDCDDATARAVIVAAARSDRRWLAGSARLGVGAPAWAAAMYRRSLLVLHALTDRRSGAVAAGARDGWAYVWPRDAATAALAFQATGHRDEARRIAGFLTGLDLNGAARFHGDGSPVPGRAPQGDAAGWVAVAGAATEVADSSSPALGGAADHSAGTASAWRNRADYQEKAPGTFLGSAIATTALDTRTERQAASAAIGQAFAGPADRRRSGTHPDRSPQGLVRSAGDPGSGADSAAAWAVRPFALPRLYPEARSTLRNLLADGGRFGIVPSADWPQRDPWSAPTAWSAWAFAALTRARLLGGDGPAEAPRGAPQRSAAANSRALADRRGALRLLADLRRAATPTGALPERVDFRTGLPTSTTPLAWSHAFAILALRELWPPAS